MPYQVKSTGRWVAQSRDSSGKRVQVGTFATPAEASAAEEMARTPRRDPFWGKIEREERCWRWTGGRDRNGYGVTANRGHRVAAHRYAYERLVGAIPEGHEIHHTCLNVLCVHPGHLLAVDRTTHAGLHVALRYDLPLGRQAAHEDLVMCGV